MSENVDITGLMAKSTAGWEERAEALCKPEHFATMVVCKLPISKDSPLTDDEWARLNKKLKLVEEWAAYMAAGMLKGTIKYPQDTWDIKQWMAHLVGEGADQSNYQMLLFNRWREEQSSLVAITKEVLEGD